MSKMAIIVRRHQPIGADVTTVEVGMAGLDRCTDKKKKKILEGLEVTPNSTCTKTKLKNDSREGAGNDRE